MNKHIFLSITERCNLNCVYCFEKNKRRKVMSFDKAIEIISEEMSRDDVDFIDFDFMGGEPFLEFERIKQICEYVWDRQWPHPYVFSAATNGTLVHGEIKDWLSAHKDQFLCFLSIDGIQTAHDLNRSGSYDRIDIDFFIKTWPKRRAKMVCSKESLAYLSESVKHLHDLGFPAIEVKLAYSFDWSSKEILSVLVEQYEKLLDFYVDNIDLPPHSLLNIDMLELNYLGKKPKKWCTCGVETYSFDMDGNRFPCRYYQDLVRFGKIKYDDIWKEDYASIQNKIKGRCRECLLRDVCRTCYAYNLDTCGDYGIKNIFSCEMTKISAYYTAKIILKREDKEPGRYSKEVLNNAGKVIEQFKGEELLVR